MVFKMPWRQHACDHGLASQVHLERCTPLGAGLPQQRCRAVGEMVSWAADLHVLEVVQGRVGGVLRFHRPLEQRRRSVIHINKPA